MTLLDLLETDGIRLKRVARTNGGEYAGSCPFCGGRDRFRVWPEQDGGRYWCRGCGKHGDAIQYLRDMRGLSFLEACAELGIDPTTRQGGHSHEPVHGGFRSRETTPPGDLWSCLGRLFLDPAKENLREENGVMTWLHKRGLRDETIDRAELGWIRTDLFLDRQAWGLKPEKTEDGKDKKLWLPAGLVIPLMENDHVSRLRIRRPAGKPRYVVVSGSDMGPMTWALDQGAVVIVESELDGLLIRQEAGDLVGVVALGSAQSKPDIEAERVLKSANTLLIALDYDKAGAEASYRHWLKSYPNARRWPVPVGKDPGEAFQMGLGIREWIEVGLRVDKLSEYAQRPTEAMIKPFPREWLQRFDESQLERLAIMTTDGQLSDQEAITLLNSGCLWKRE